MNTSTLTRLLPLRQRSVACCTEVREPRMTKPETSRLADRLKALGDPTRLGIMDLLVQQEEPLCVCDITPRFSRNQPTISHHLRLLREAGLIETEKQGIWSYYCVTDLGRRCLAAVPGLE